MARGSHSSLAEKAMYGNHKTLVCTGTRFNLEQDFVVVHQCFVPNLFWDPPPNAFCLCSRFHLVGCNDICLHNLHHLCSHLRLQ
jgi:hypothetical protein